MNAAGASRRCTDVGTRGVCRHAGDCAALATRELPHVRHRRASRRRFAAPARLDVPEFCRVAGRSAARPRIRRSASKCGCPRTAGTAVTTSSATAASRVRSPSGARRRAASWQCGRCDRYGASRRCLRRVVGAGHPEKIIDYGYRVAQRDLACSQGAGARLLRDPGALQLFHRLLQRRPAGADGGPALPGGLGRHPRRRSCVDWTRQLATFAWIQHALRTLPAAAASRVVSEGPTDPQTGERLYLGFQVEPDVTHS